MFKAGNYYTVKMACGGDDFGSIEMFTGKVIAVKLPLITIVRDNEETIINTASSAFISAAQYTGPTSLPVFQLPDSITKS